MLANHLNEQQLRAFRIVDNRVGEYSQWDIDKLILELEEVGLDIENLGIDFDGIIKDFDLLSEFEEDDEMEICLPSEPKSKLGDIYQLGTHRVMCGDSRVLEDLKALIGDEKIDLLQTDPPYNVNYEGKIKASLTICTAIDWKIRQYLIWEKNMFTLGRQDYQWVHEPCLYGWKSGAAHQWNNDRAQTTILKFDKSQKNEQNPTMKPLAMIGYQIQNNTKKGDNVLDLFGGSGTSLIACELSVRNCFMMEYDPRYVDVIIDRWVAQTGKEVKKIT